MTYCYKGYCTRSKIFDIASTGGVVTALAYYMLKSGYVSGVLVSRRYETFIAKNLVDLLDSCGSIYEDFNYTTPLYDRDEYAQIGKPCDIDSKFKLSISIFCSSIFAKQSNPISKKNLRNLSSTKRYLKGFFVKPNRCRNCKDHVGSNADICVGDSQLDPKMNHVIIQSKLGKLIWDRAVKDGLISAEPISFTLVKNRQPYLWKGGLIKWIIKKVQKSF